MGAEMSTMGSMLSSYTVEASTRQTMLGVIIATPLFISYFVTIRDYYLNGNSTTKQTHSSIDSDFCIDEDLPLFEAHPMLVSPTSSSADTADAIEAAPSFLSSDDELGCADVSTEQAPLMAESEKKTLGVPCSRTSEYLVTLSIRLAEKSKTADHSDKIGISEVLYQLGEILFNDNNFKDSKAVLLKAERVQKQIIDETMVSVASAMYKQGNYYNEHGNAALGKLYLETAIQLRQDASPTALGKAWAVHTAHKPKRCKDSDLKELLKKVERRLKRASGEAKPLVKTLQLKASCVRHEHVAASEPVMGEI